MESVGRGVGMVEGKVARSQARRRGIVWERAAVVVVLQQSLAPRGLRPRVAATGSGPEWGCRAAGDPEGQRVGQFAFSISELHQVVFSSHFPFDARGSAVSATFQFLSASMHHLSATLAPPRHAQPAEGGDGGRQQRERPRLRHRLYIGLDLDREVAGKAKAGGCRGGS